MSCLKNYCTAFHVSIGSAGELLIPFGSLANRFWSTRAIFVEKYPLTYESIMNTPICFACLQIHIEVWLLEVLL